jgi:hypothetical protein
VTGRARLEIALVLPSQDRTLDPKELDGAAGMALLRNRRPRVVPLPDVPALDGPECPTGWALGAAPCAMQAPVIPLSMACKWRHDLEVMSLLAISVASHESG